MPLLRRRIARAGLHSWIGTLRIFGFSFALFVLLSWSILTSGGIWAALRFPRPEGALQRQKGLGGVHSQHSSCVAWRRTDHCTPFGCSVQICCPQNLACIFMIIKIVEAFKFHYRTRVTGQDRDCLTWIRQGSGYCECSGGRTVKRYRVPNHTV